MIGEQTTIPVFITTFGVLAEARRMAFEEGGFGKDPKELEFEIALLDMRKNGLVEIGREIIEDNFNIFGAIFSVKEEEIAKLQEKARKYFLEEWSKKIQESAA